MASTATSRTTRAKKRMMGMESPPPLRSLPSLRLPSSSKKEKGKRSSKKTLPLLPPRCKPSEASRARAPREGRGQGRRRTIAALTRVTIFLVGGGGGGGGGSRGSGVFSSFFRFFFQWSRHLLFFFVRFDDEMVATSILSVSLFLRKASSMLQIKKLKRRIQGRTLLE